MEPDRRALLQTLAALAAWSASAHAQVAGKAVAPAEPSAADLASFSVLSAALNGVPVDDPLAAARVMRVFDTPARRASWKALATLVASTPPDELDAALKTQRLDALANEIVSTWYSGVANVAGGQQAVLYLNALMWGAMTYTKPMGVCGGPTGYWADPPS
ncbi:MAG TPA: sugar dehydrogenase complex small subunit [Casimicrobiaceae bacterium]